MNRTSNIKQICHDRGIKILVHFTHIENLRRILGEGLLSRETLVHLGKRNWSYQFDLRLSLRHGLSRNPEGFDVHFYMSQDLRHDALETIRDPLKKKPIFNDPNRLDKHPEAICLSIGFPNYKMFFKYASEKQSQWVVLLLDAKLLWELDCAFCQENAASNAVYTIPLKERKKSDALNNMFIDYDSISRQSLSIPDHYPTYPQAEVLVCNPIPVAYIKEVHFYEKPALEQWCSKNSGMDTETFLVSKQYFHPRCDWKVWTDEAERQRQKQAAEEAERQRQERVFIAQVGYEPSPVGVNDKGETDLHIATKLNLPALTTFLITHGAEVNAKNKYGNTPLHIAATENAHQTAEVLLIHNAEVNAKNEYGSTSLHITAYKNAYQTVKVLLIHDAEVNAKDKDGDTPLHNAALKNAYQTAAVLLNQGAHVNAKNKDGETPLHFARSNNALEVAKILQRYGGY